MDIISADQFNDICNQKDSKVVQTICGKPKVLETESGEMVKLFYPRKKRVSSNSYKPYAVRFCNNARLLRSLDFIAPDIKKIQYCPELITHVVYYGKLAGETMDVCPAIKTPESIIPIVAFVARLHNKGVFFRSIHLSNLLYNANGDFALIDISDVKFTKKSLPLYLRYRNLKHVLLYKEDQNIWKNFGVNKFLHYYFKFSNSSFFTRKILTFLLGKKLD